MSHITLNYLHLCDEANFSQEGKLNMLGIFDQINITTFPGGIAKAKLVCNMTLHNQEKEIVLTLQFLNAQTNQHILKPITINVIPNNNASNNTFGVMIDLVQIQFDKAGEYLIQIHHQEKLVGQTILKVQQHTPAAG